VTRTFRALGIHDQREVERKGEGADYFPNGRRRIDLYPFEQAPRVFVSQNFSRTSYRVCPRLCVLPGERLRREWSCSGEPVNMSEVTARRCGRDDRSFDPFITG